MSWLDDIDAVQRLEPSTACTIPPDETELFRCLFDTPMSDPTEDKALPLQLFETRPPRRRLPTSPPSYVKKKTFACSICTEDLPIRCFLNRCSLVMPYSCYDHLSLKWSISEGGPGQEEAENSEPVCRSCLSRYLLEQFRTRGAERIRCLRRDCEPPYPDQAWKYFAIHFLPKQVQHSFNEELARAIQRSDKWVCPADCGCEEGWTATPNMTDGWPHVECPSCSGRFCAACRVPWHPGLSCQNFQRSRRWQKQSPSLSVVGTLRSLSFTNESPPYVSFSDGKKETKSNYRSIREMQARGARLCPRCQTPIIKDGGCNHMWCIKCELHFTWREAEKVHAMKQDNAMVKRIRKPFRYIGAWFWVQRANWGMWREGKRKDQVLCGLSDDRRHGYDDDNHVD
jgi:hypothetical protein